MSNKTIQFYSKSLYWKTDNNDKVLLHLEKLTNIIVKFRQNVVKLCITESQLTKTY